MAMNKTTKETVKTEVKPAETKAIEPKTVQTKAVQTKTAAESTVKEETKPVAKKPAAKKPVAKKTTTKAEKKTTIFIQYAGKEFSQQDIVDIVEKAWATETGKKTSLIKNLDIYVKPEESAAYYVINDKVAGRVQL